MLGQLRSHREIASALIVGVGTTSQVVARAKRAHIATWSEICEHDRVNFCL